MIWNLNKEIHHHRFIQSRMSSERRVDRFGLISHCFYVTEHQKSSPAGRGKPSAQFTVNKKPSVVETAPNMLPLVQSKLGGKCKETLVDMLLSASTIHGFYKKIFMFF